MSGYFGASLRALAAAGVDITLVYRESVPEAPFDEASLAFEGRRLHWADADGPREVLRALGDAEADVVLVASWNFRDYVRFARDVKRRRPETVTVMAMDNQWLETPKQWAGRLVASVYVARGFDAAFVPGDRQVAFAERMGFRDRPILQGLYCADDTVFGSGDRAQPESSFLYVGRMIPEVKGLETLIAAYQIYRDQVTDPWPLRLSGGGPLAGEFASVRGATVVGFSQPSDVARLMAQSGCLVLPSAFEPWGVVVHEAALSGLPLVLSSRVGAASAFLREGRNGYGFSAGSVTELAGQLTRIHHHTSGELRAMSEVSRELGGIWTTAEWAAKFAEDVAYLSRAATRDRADRTI
jgi:glycosyltransferase involved in cell wall biosynthesis